MTKGDAQLQCNKTVLICLKYVIRCNLLKENLIFIVNFITHIALFMMDESDYKLKC